MGESCNTGGARYPRGRSLHRRGIVEGLRSADAMQDLLLSKCAKSGILPPHRRAFGKCRAKCHCCNSTPPYDRHWNIGFHGILYF
jgi:hypothetical protein